MDLVLTRYTPFFWFSNNNAEAVIIAFIEIVLFHPIHLHQAEYPPPHLPLQFP